MYLQCLWFGVSHGLVAIAHIKTRKDERCATWKSSTRFFQAILNKNLSANDGWFHTLHFWFQPGQSQNCCSTKIFQLRVERQQSHGGFEWGRWKLKHESDFMFWYSYPSIWCLQKTTVYMNALTSSEVFRTIICVNICKYISLASQIIYTIVMNKGKGRTWTYYVFTSL